MVIYCHMEGAASEQAALNSSSALARVVKMGGLQAASISTARGLSVLLSSPGPMAAFTKHRRELWKMRASFRRERPLKMRKRNSKINRGFPKTVLVLFKV